MAAVNCVYLLIFLPLIAAVFCQIFSSRKIVFVITLFCCFALLALSLMIFPLVVEGKAISSDFNLSLLSIALEFKIDIVSYFFLLLALLSKIIILCFYHFDIKTVINDKNAKIFYAVFLINIFGLVNIIATNNFFNLFAAIEIYSLSFLAISALSKDQELLRIIFRDFCLNVTASILILFSFLTAYLFFKQSDFVLISETINSLSADQKIIPLVMLLFLVLAFMIKFFPFWLFFDKIKNSSQITNFLVAESIFIKGLLGLFLLLKFFYFYFGKEFLLNEVGIGYPLMATGVAIIVFSSVGIYYQKHLQSVASYLCLGNIGFAMVTIATNNRQSLYALFFYLLNFALADLFLFTFASFLKRHFDSSSISKFSLLGKKYPFLTLPLKLCIFFVAAFPLTPLFLANSNLADVGLNFGFSVLILIGLSATIITSFDFAVRAIDEFLNNNNGENLSTLTKGQYWFYLVFFWMFLLLVMLSIFVAIYFNQLPQNFSSYLALS